MCTEAHAAEHADEHFEVNAGMQTAAVLTNQLAEVLTSAQPLKQGAAYVRRSLIGCTRRSDSSQDQQ